MSNQFAGNLADYISTHAYVDESQLHSAIAYQKQIGGRLENILVNLGYVHQEDIPIIYSGYLNIPLLSFDCEFDISTFDFSMLDLDELYSKNAVPFELTDAGVVHLAVTDPLSIELYEYIDSFLTEYKIFVCNQNQLTSIKSILDSKKQMSSGADSGVKGELDRIRELAFGAPTVNLVNRLIIKGVRLGASDLHIEPISGGYRARYRVDGILHESETIPQELQLAVVSRIKILAGMDIAEKRKPQDGKIETSVAGNELDIRCSALPLGEGESVVMRFLIKKALKFDISDLGYEDDLIERIDADLKRTSGVVLMTGPTGSGKTTSLYSFLSKVNQPEVKIITLEDPIEYQLAGVNQVQIRPEIGFDFAKGLRSIVRQDPDIIMIGEIRDNETAKIAMQSALTGHLVFSTVHTNDAPTAFTRLLDLGVEEFLLNASVISVMAQRLVRKLCDHCKTPLADSLNYLSSEDALFIKNNFDVSDVTLYKAQGCEHCGGSGFKGRIAILEYLPNDKFIQQLSKSNDFMQQVDKYRSLNKLRTLRQDGLLKVFKGLTTYEEVCRVAG